MERWVLCRQAETPTGPAKRTFANSEIALYALRCYTHRTSKGRIGGILLWRHIPMARKVADCRKFPSESACSLTIAGTEDEVLKVAARHAVEEHGHQDTPELREQIRAMLIDEA